VLPFIFIIELAFELTIAVFARVFVFVVVGAVWQAAKAIAAILNAIAKVIVFIFSPVLIF
jgi:hypothetical protein